MDGLSGVASGMAVVSLSIQLVETVGKIRAFIRNVKDAPKEIERLVGLLEKLEMLLSDVRDIMDRQALLQGQHFPTPSATILHCLQSCEQTLQPLHDIIERSQLPKTPHHSAMAKLKNGIAFGFKTKDIATWEARIEREVNYLHTALGSNSNTLLTSMLPLLLQGQQTIISMHTNPPSNGTTQLSVSTTSQNTVYPSNTSSKQVSTRYTAVSSPLERFGIYQRKRTKRIRFTTSKNCQEDIVSEDDELSVAWKIVGYGLTWTMHRSCNRLFPSLRVFPVVPNFSRRIEHVIEKGTVQQLQELFAAGTVHPFERNSEGWSLLHLASVSYRAEMCQLLIEYGVKPEPSHSGLTPLILAVWFGYYTSSPDEIDTMRYFFNDKTMIEDFSYWQFGEFFPGKWDINMMQWLWQQSQHVLSGDDRSQLQCYLTRRTWRYYAFGIEIGDGWGYLAQGFPELAMNPEVLEALESGRCKLLQAVFSGCFNASDSYFIGDELVKWLDRSGVDVKTCISNELAYMPEGIVYTAYCTNRGIVFEPRGNKGWTLGFEWVIDPGEIGYLVISEYQVLGPGNRYVWEWPFYDRKYPFYSDEAFIQLYPKKNARFERRIATKARKKYAQEWRNLPQSKMPGEWIW